jgi:hypothetical protein
MEKFASFRVFVIDDVFNKLFKFVHETLQVNGSM